MLALSRASRRLQHLVGHRLWILRGKQHSPGKVAHRKTGRKRPRVALPHAQGPRCSWTRACCSSL